jgi:hypothetical protein
MIPELPPGIGGFAGGLINSRGVGADFVHRTRPLRVSCNTE